ncbi:MAG TPA: methyltransferase domain-containing protein [Pseudolysinimonas sp.]|jgi:SAM-dependent methyltransferase
MGDPVTYEPRIFTCRTTEEARAVILNDEAGLNTNERWKRETPYLAELMEWPENTRVVIDYGCGIGRMMNAVHPAVLGVDFSPSMRAQGEAYLMHEERRSCGFVSPELLDLIVERGFRAQGAMAVWSLQHVLLPHEAVRQIFNALPPGAPFYVVNRDNRAVPALRDGHFSWINDGVVIKDVVESGGFVLAHEEPMPDTLCMPGAWFRRYERAHV